MGLTTFSSIVLRLMELMSGRSRLGSSSVRLCCDGYTLQQKSPGKYKKKLFFSLSLGRVANSVQLLPLYRFLVKAEKYFTRNSKI